tara:strand:+ start:8452 stop:11778 length:3327 start_codon:yes stop_codon:yes gene_type:complete
MGEQDFRNRFINRVPSSTSVERGTVIEKEINESNSQIESNDPVKSSSLIAEIINKPSRETGMVTEGANVEFEEALVENAPILLKGLDTTLGATGAGQFMRSFNKMVYALPDTALNALNVGLDAAGFPDVYDKDLLQRIGASGDYERAKTIVPYLLSIGSGKYVGATKDDSYLNQLADTSGFAASFVVPSTIAQKMAAGISKVPEVGVKLGKYSNIPWSNVRDAFLNPFRSAPATVVGAETALSGLSGVGQQVEEDAFGTNTGIGAIGVPLTLGGAFTVTKNLSPMNNAFRWIKNIGLPEYRMSKSIATAEDTVPISKLTEGARGKAVEGVLREDLRSSQRSAVVRKNIAEATEMEKTLNKFTEANEPVIITPAERTLDPKLLNTQKSAEMELGSGGTARPAFVEANMNRKEAALIANRKFLSSILNPENQKNVAFTENDAPLFIYDPLKKQYTSTVALLNNEGRDVTTAWDKMMHDANGVIPLFNSKAAKNAGINIRSDYLKKYEVAKASAESLAKKLKINDSTMLATAEQTLAAQSNVRQELNIDALDISLDKVHPFVKTFIDKKFGTNNRINFQDWRSFRNQVTSGIGQAAANRNGTQVRELTVLAKELDGMAEQFGRTNSAIGKNFNKFNTWYGENIIVPFERSGLIKIASKGPGSIKENPIYRIPDENVAEAFLKDTNTAKQFMKLFGDDQAYVDNMESVLLDRLRGAAYSENIAGFKPEKYNTWLNDNDALLDTLGLSTKFKDTKTLLDDIVLRNRELTARREVVESNLLNKAILKNTAGSETPEQFIDDALRTPKLMLELKKKILDPKGEFVKNLGLKNAEKAFLAAVTRKALSTNPSALDNPRNFLDLLDVETSDIARSLQNAFTPQHIKNLTTIADATDRFNRTGINPEMLKRLSGTAAGFAEKFNQLTGVSIPSASSQIRAAKESRISGQFVAINLLVRSFAKQGSVRADEMFRAMMFDPEIAQLLATNQPAEVGVGGILPKYNRLINNFLFRTGVDYQGEDPTTEFGVSSDQPVTEIDSLETPVENETVVPLPSQSFNPERGEELNIPPVAPVAPVIPATTASVDNSSGIASLGVGDLFPFDSTGQAIEKRRMANQFT